jgi:copper chaperone CopZ
MKTLKLFFAVLLAAVFSFGAQAQTTQKSDSKARTETIKVSGNCEMCKARIEKAAKTEGVSSASWDSKTKLLTVSYDPSKTSTDALAKKVAAVGHDAGKYKADDKTYEALPACCHYERK